MKVVILAQYFPPDKPGRIPEELARTLSRRGHSVRVVTAFPHYNEGRIAAGYRQRWRHIELNENVKVKRVPIFASHSSSAIGRIFNYLSFACSSRMSTSYVKDADVVYVHGTPATVAHAALVWSKRRGIPYLYHVQDIWPESVTGSGFLPSSVTKWVDRIINSWLRRVYRGASAVVVIAPTAKKLLAERGASPEKIRVIYNWAREDHPVAVSSSNAASGGLRLLYAGNLGPLQDLETLLMAIASVKDLHNLRLRIAGSGVLDGKLRQMVSELDLAEHVEFLGLLSPLEMIQAYAEADFQIVPLKRLDIFTGTIPSKLQAGLAHRVPVITTVQGDVAELVGVNGLGFVANPEDISSLATAIRDAYETSADERGALKERAGAFYLSNLTQERAIDQIEETLKSIRRTTAE